MQYSVPESKPATDVSKNWKPHCSRESRFDARCTTDPLPLLSYGGSAMMVLLVGFGLVQSAHVHRPR